MNKLTHWIKDHQVIAFFIITFTITWGLGFSLLATYKGIVLLAPLGFLSICGPALAGIIITAVTNTQTRQGTRRASWIAFCVAWGVSALVFLAHNTFINLAPFSPIMVGFTLLLVMPVAFVISMAYSRIPALQNYLISLIRLRGVWGWSLLALACFPMFALVSILISRLFGRQAISPGQYPQTGLALIGLIVVKFFYQFFFFNATGEEVGWRGFALPRLQARVSPLIASIVIAFFWVPWHLILYLAEGQPVLSVSYWVETFLLHISSSIIIGWLYNRSKGSILVAGVAHAAGNCTFSFLPAMGYWNVLIMTIYAFVLVIVLVDRMWKKLPSDHPAVYRGPVMEG